MLKLKNISHWGITITKHVGHLFCSKTVVYNTALTWMTENHHRYTQSFHDNQKSSTIASLNSAYSHKQGFCLLTTNTASRVLWDNQVAQDSNFFPYCCSATAFLSCCYKRDHKPSSHNFEKPSLQWRLQV